MRDLGHEAVHILSVTVQRPLTNDGDLTEYSTIFLCLCLAAKKNEESQLNPSMRLYISWSAILHLCESFCTVLNMSKTLTILLYGTLSECVLYASC